MFGIIKDIETYIKSWGRYKDTAVGSEFKLNVKRLPLCIVKAGSGGLQDYVIGQMKVDIVVILHSNRNLEEQKLDDLEALTAYLRDYEGAVMLNPEFSFDSAALSVFWQGIEVAAPFGAYRLSYDIDFRMD